MDFLLLFAAAFLAGIMNAVAGGGSFVTFPALVFTGVPSIVANASSTVAVSPGSFASAWAYRRDFPALPGLGLWPLAAASLTGGICGALLLLYTPQHTFDAIIPWLLLGATLLFAVGRRLTSLLLRVVTVGPVSLTLVQFAIGIYGGYFGGAIGILMLALFGLFGLSDIHEMNALKTLLAGLMNGAAVICFALAGKVWWPQTLTMLVAAVIGGYVGARIARRMNPAHIRAIIIAIGSFMTVVFFLRA
ncbi:MAG TPA: sulfite exporter TauE/SafE family protein [Aliidongia sp.]|nr:sulfite exporter TauE/SafE family protein [Aliidongia sp.]